jgi:putative N6-adenine-specific DNA methylase
VARVAEVTARTEDSAAREFFAPCTLGLEEVLAREVSELAGADVATIEVRRGGVAFRGEASLRYRANLWLRSAVRVQEKVAEGAVRGREQLHQLVSEVAWERWLDPSGTLAVDASVRDSEITHSGFAALAVKDAICDRFRSRTRQRPSVDADDPTLPVKLVLQRDRATLYLNTSGESLHKRGWRPIQVKSPLNEAIAAGLLLLTNWDRRSALVDPMCGSGTFLVEAACLAADRAPGMLRRFAFERFADFDAESWHALKDEARQRAKLTLPFAIEGADRHEGALSLAHRSVRAAQVEGLVKLVHADLKSFTPSTPPPRFTLVTNPPWGERLGEGEDLERSWDDLGEFLLAKCEAVSAFVLSGSPQLPPRLRLRAKLKWPVMDGPIECRWLRYDVIRSARIPRPDST